MPEEDEVFAGKIKQKGIFDFKEFYRFCYMWLVDKKYFLQEKEYSESITPVGKEVKIIWEARRKISDYFAFLLKVNWRILGLKDVEVEQDGAKITLSKGEPEIKVTAILVKDYEKRWETSSFYKFLRGLYDRYIVRARIEKYEEKIYMDADEFLAQAKAFLALEGKH